MKCDEINPKPSGFEGITKRFYVLKSFVEYTRGEANFLHLNQCRVSNKSLFYALYFQWNSFTCILLYVKFVHTLHNNRNDETGTLILKRIGKETVRGLNCHS